MQDIWRPALWIVAGMALVAFSDNFIARVSESMGLWQFQVLRAATALPVVALALLLSGRLAALRARSPWRVAVRSALSITGLMLYFAAIPAVPMAQAASGLFTSPIWIALFTVAVLRERVGALRMLAIVLGFAGVVVVQGVGAEPLRPMSLAAVAGGAFYGMGVIWTRRQCRDESALALGFWQFVGFLAVGLAGLVAVAPLGRMLGGIEGAGFLSLGWQPVGWAPLSLVAFIGLSGLIASSAIAVGYKSGESSLMGLFDFSFLIWAPFFAWALWGESIGLRTGAGMAMIIAAGGLATLSGRPARETPTDTG